MTGLFGGSYSETVSEKWSILMEFRVSSRQSTAEAEGVYTQLQFGFKRRVDFQVAWSVFAFIFAGNIVHEDYASNTEKCFSSINEMIAGNVVLERSCWFSGSDNFIFGTYCWVFRAPTWVLKDQVINGKGNCEKGTVLWSAPVFWPFVSDWNFKI